MAIKFCTECGKKVEYKFSPPKFCAECGTPTYPWLFSWQTGAKKKNSNCKRY